MSRDYESCQRSYDFNLTDLVKVWEMEGVTEQRPMTMVIDELREVISGSQTALLSEYFRLGGGIREEHATTCLQLWGGLTLQQERLDYLWSIDSRYEEIWDDEHGYCLQAIADS